MLKKVADALLNCVYYPITAVVALDAQEHIQEVRLFDTGFCNDADYSFTAGASEIAVLFNHPEGWLEISEREKEILERVRESAPQVRIRAYLCGEDIGCRAVECES